MCIFVYLYFRIYVGKILICFYMYYTPGICVVNVILVFCIFVYWFVWILGFVFVCIYVYQYIRIFRWLYACMSVFVLTVYLYIYIPMYSYICVYLCFGIFVLRYICFMVCLYYGICVPRVSHQLLYVCDICIRVFSYFSIFVYWYFGMVVPFNICICIRP